MHRELMLNLAFGISFAILAVCHGIEAVHKLKKSHSEHSLPLESSEDEASVNQRGWLIDILRGYQRLTDQNGERIVLKFERNPPKKLADLLSGGGFKPTTDSRREELMWTRQNDFEGRVRAQQIDEEVRAISVDEFNPGNSIKSDNHISENQHYSLIPRVIFNMWHEFAGFFSRFLMRFFAAEVVAVVNAPPSRKEDNSLQANPPFRSQVSDVEGNNRAH